MGRRIVESEQKGKKRAEYGKELMVQLGTDLTKRFGRGFSWRNIFQMRSFYLAYPAILQTVSAKSSSLSMLQTSSGKSFADIFPLSWSHYVTLIAVKDDSERSFYEIESTQNNWSVRELKRQYDSGLYERLVLSKDKMKVKQLAGKGQLVEKPEDVIKSPYILEFLGLDEKADYTESDLESAIINRIEHFLLEMGKGFLFGGASGKIFY